MRLFFLAIIMAASLAALINSLPEIKSVLPKDFSAKEFRSSGEKISEFAKEQVHGLQSFLTTDPLEKAELELRYSAERLGELEKTSSNRTAEKEVIERKLKNYTEARKRLEKSLDRLEKSGKLTIDKIPAEKPAPLPKLKSDKKPIDQELQDKIRKEKEIQREVEQKLTKLKKEAETKVQITPQPDHGPSQKEKPTNPNDAEKLETEKNKKK